MSKEIKTNLQFDVNNVITVDDKVLVKPGPIKKVLTIEQTPKKSNKKTKPGQDNVQEMETKRTVTRSNHRVGEVINSPEDSGYSKGDIVVYNQRDAIALDILADQDPDPECPVIIRKYSIIAKLDDSLEAMANRIEEINVELDINNDK